MIAGRVLRKGRSRGVAVDGFSHIHTPLCPAIGGAVGCMAAASLELPARLDPSHVTTICPLASAATQGKTLDFPTAPSRLTRTGDVQVLPRSEDQERKMSWLSDQTV